jgi:3-oxoacyl-[acyl-carrier protein] reductase
MSKESQRVAIVTGASGGIGRAIAERLARDGFDIAVHFAGNAGKAQEAVAAIEALGRRAIAVQGDVAEAGDVARLFGAAQEAFGRIDVVVNSAGIMPLAAIDPDKVEDFDRTIATNLRGSFLVLGHAARHLKEGGRIVAVSSSVLAKSFPGYGAYIASKAGAEGLVHVLANELRGRGITVNAIAPDRRPPSCSSRGNRTSRSPRSPGRRRWNASGNPRRSRRRCPSWPGRTAPG